MARGQAYSDDIKAAVMAALLTGQSVSDVAREYRLSKATVIAWRNASGLVRSTTVQPEKGAELGDLVADYLREVLTTLAAQARSFRDGDWIKKQAASEVAVLHGVLADKAIRILAALESDDGDSAPVDTAPAPGPPSR